MSFRLEKFDLYLCNLANMKLDVIVWGATGFTGRLVVEYLSKVSANFGIAGRNKEKLLEISKELSINVPIFVSDFDNIKDLEQIVKSTKVVLSAVGPYSRFGLDIVECCVRLKTDYVDLCGELDFILEIIEKFHTKAAENNVLIVPSCGFDSIPSDMGTFMLANHFKKNGLSLDNVRCSLWDAKGSGVSGGTIASAINLFESKPYSSILSIASKPDFLCPNMDTNSKTWKGNFLFYYDEGLQKWQAPFLMELINMRTVRRSNYLLNYGPNFNYCEGTASSNIFSAALISMASNMVTLSLILPPFRWLLSKIFPAGSGPSKEKRLNGSFKIKLFGEAIDENGEKISAIVDVEGKGDPGYGETAKMVSESALCLALNRKDCHDQGGFKGGVVTPAASMGNVLIERLRAAGMVFKIK